jgi:translocator protein
MLHKSVSAFVRTTCDKTKNESTFLIPSKTNVLEGDQTMNIPARDAHLHPVLGFKSLLALLFSVLLVMAASIAGQVFTQPALVGWYAGLIKPAFNPPNIVFPLVWTMLYALMAVSFWRVLRARSALSARRLAIIFFFIQLGLNILWSYAFFARQSPIAGLVVIGLLLLAIVLTLRAFLPIDRAAGYAMVPYALWVGFAGVLNGAIAVLNP